MIVEYCYVCYYVHRFESALFMSPISKLAKAQGL